MYGRRVRSSILMRRVQVLAYFHYHDIQSGPGCEQCVDFAGGSVVHMHAAWTAAGMVKSIDCSYLTTSLQPSHTKVWDEWWIQSTNHDHPSYAHLIPKSGAEGTMGVNNPCDTWHHMFGSWTHMLSQVGNKLPYNYRIEENRLRVYWVEG